RRWVCCGSSAPLVRCRRERTHEAFVREPDALNVHVRFDEGEVETGQGEAREAPATERAGNRLAPPKPPRHLPTLPSFFPVLLTAKNDECPERRSDSRR